ncbi:MAG: hypothetical protein WAW23_08420 [Candidatus Methanoperedens sp.]
MEKPTIVIVIEGGVVVNVATADSNVIYRIIDIDAIKSDENAPEYTDYVPDTENADIEQVTKDILRDVK